MSEPWVTPNDTRQAAARAATGSWRAEQTRVRRVAIVITELRVGGAERVIVHLACALARQGIKPTVICLGRPGPLACDLDAAGVPVVALGSTRGHDVAAIWRLARLLQRIRPDVINVHDRASLPYVDAANRLSGRRPVVFSCHGLLLDVVRSRWCERFAMRRAAALTAVSEETGRRYVALLDWPGPVDVVPNGIPLPEPKAEKRLAARADLGLTHDVFAFLAVGNLKPEKGFEDLLEAAAVLRDRLGACPFTVFIAGGTSDEAYAQDLEASVDRLDLRDTLRLLGYRPDTQALYAAADAFVLSSRTEGLPMVLLEAMAAGLPVVATRVGGVPDVVTDGENGLLAAAGAPPELADAMARLVDDETLRTRVGAEARRHIRRVYSTRRMADAYLQAYRHAVATKTDALGKQEHSVLMLGPLPPLRGGMATVTDNLRRSALARQCRLTVLNNGKATPKGRSLLTGLIAQLRLLVRVVGCIRRFRTQIVHIQTCALFSFWRDSLHLLVSRALGCRVILHIHDGSFEGFLRDQPPLRGVILRRVLRMASRVIVLSRMSLESLQPLVPEAEWRVVLNGVPIPPRVVRSSGRPVTLLFLGNLTERKGAYDLLAATRLAKERGFAGSVHLAGGETARGQVEAFERRVVEQDCASQVMAVGFLEGRTKDAALDSADGFVLPSYVEGLPMAILEAMAHGLPVIATRVGAVPEAVTDGREGLLVEPGDVEALADRMLRLANDAALRRRMGEAARRRAEAEFSLDAMVARIVALYDGLSS